MKTDISSILAYWVHNLSPFVVQFPEGFFLKGIYWYGVAYLVGFIIAGLLLRLYYRKGIIQFNEDAQWELLTYLVVGVLVGGRLGYMLLYNFSNFIQNPLIIFELNNGGIAGMASHGGIVGVLLAVYLFARKNKKA